MFEVINTADGSRMSHPVKGSSSTLFGSEQEALEWIDGKRLSKKQYVVKEVGS